MIVPDTAQRRAGRLAAADTAVSVRGVSKDFRLPHHRYSTLKERALHPFATHSYDELHALDHVNLDVKQGEFFGIVGRNGSGKSTLLKCLAGIYSIDHGEIEVRGQLSPFIELGVGFNPDLTARDNVLINAVMLGLTRREARARFEDIMAFAELEQFVDLKLKNYSSGMAVRLGFSVAVSVHADVLLVDEVLAVGDASFQRKCFQEFDRLKDEGCTILFVTHDMGSVERFCDRAIVLERGRVVDIGAPEEVTRTYSELNFGDAVERTGEELPAKITAAWCEGHDGERILGARQGQEVSLCFEVTFVRDLVDPTFAVIMRNEVRHTIFMPTSELTSGPTGSFAAGGRATVRFGFVNRLAPSRYTLTPCVGPPGAGYGEHARLGRADDLAALLVEGPVTGGVVDLPVELDVKLS